MLSNAPPPLLPKTGDLVLSSNPNDTSFTKIDPLELARQLTLIDIKNLKSLRPKEFLGQAWEKKDKEVKCPNITRMIQQTNAITKWVVAKMLSVGELKERVGLLKFFITLAQKCRELNNFNSLTSVVAGLSMGPVKRLRKTWEVEKKSTLLMKVCRCWKISTPKFSCRFRNCPRLSAQKANMHFTDAP